MKHTLIALVTVLGFTSAHATVSVNWNSGANAIKDNLGANAPNTWIAQLIWSPDNVISPVNPASPFVPTESEQVYFQQQMSAATAGRIISGQQNNSDNTLAGGFVYTRVFNVDFNGGSPSIPTFFGNSPVIAGPLLVQDSDPTNGTEIISYIAATSTNLLNVNQQIVAVPEPSTYAFLGMGAVLIARRLRKR